MEIKLTIFLLISWIIAGLFSVLLIFIHDLRNEEFDDNYLDLQAIVGIIILIICGFISFTVVTISYIIYIINKKVSMYSIKYNINKFVYNLANIGIKKKYYPNVETIIEDETNFDDNEEFVPIKEE